MNRHVLSATARAAVETFRLLRDATYNEIAYDCWGERGPSVTEFRCVIADQMHHRMTPAQRHLWALLPRRTKTDILGRP